MKFLRLFLAVVFLNWIVPAALAASTKVDLTLGAEAARPGDTVMAGIRLHMEPGWHTYWRNPGGSGQATTIEWELPPGITAGEIQWPTPEKLPAEELTTYIYKDDAVLLVPLTIGTNVTAGALVLKASIHWLECNNVCRMGNGGVQAALTVGAESKPGPNASLITAWQKKLPLVKTNLNARAWWEAPATTNDSRTLLIEWSGSSQGADFYPYSSDKYDVQFTVKPVPGNGKARIEKTVKKLEGDWPATISGLLVQQSFLGDIAAYAVSMPIAANEHPEAVAAIAPTTTSPTVVAANNQITDMRPALPSDVRDASLPRQSLIIMLLYAFIGGLVLNIMPCVLPVIALKILGFVSQGGSHPGRVRRLGLIYAVGVIVSFLVLAAAVIAVKLAGHRANWGMQFSNPQFIVVMTVLVTLVALNLFGVFEVNLSGKMMGHAGQLSAKEGNAGAFFNGVLATILATPCSAPFLGIALGFAFTQTYGVIILIFLTVGLGLATPYVVLSWNPALLKLLPKPGAWMNKFKVAMGFPMLATAVWLFDLTTVHYGRRVLWLALFLVMVAMAAWVYGEFVQRGRNRKGLGLAVTVLILAGGYFYAIEGQLMWRTPMNDANRTAATQAVPGGIPWQPWSAKAVTEARAAGHPVLVDFTADWCQVCLVNRKTSIEIARVREKLKELHAVALEGDYTLSPPAITDELTRFGRAAVPLVVVYPGNLAKAPIVLPDGYLTPGIVLNALDKAAAN